MTLSYTTLLLFLIWRIYWRLTEVKADREKEKTKEKIEFIDNIQNIANLGVFLLLGAQLFGLSLLPFSSHMALLERGGFGLVCIGFIICIFARISLGTNWANSYEFQIKENHELVTHGIYQYIRHPIYIGLFFMLVGGELVVQSYLVFVYMCILGGMYWQGRREEVLLKNHFGKTYYDYMKRSKMFIPFVW
jgi:protein-S-isoprenylcysteine O-methyltransferase Ste14